MKLVIGLVGPPGAGKETFTNSIESLLRADGFSATRHRFSDPLRETLSAWGIPHGRENEQKLARIMKEPAAFRDGALSRAIKHRLMRDEAHVGILDGVRWLSDEKMLYAFPEEGVKSIMVHVTAPAKDRYRWLKDRNRAGAAETTWESFLEQEKAENEIYIPEIGGRAAVKLVNSGSVDEFLKKIEVVYRESIRPLLG
ncbi:MAG TPA: hypothetical protein VNG29_00460 [Candidatus Paceibacterota bacterium]|nr:hypothetical protein [Candidatus Paceibacterota bacterium]